MKSTPKPRFAFDLWCFGAGDRYVCEDADYPINRFQRIFYKTRGYILMRLFGWWWWVEDKR